MREIRIVVVVEAIEIPGLFAPDKAWASQRFVVPLPEKPDGQVADLAARTVESVIDTVRRVVPKDDPK